MLRNIAKIHGANIMAVLDCCREKLGSRPIPKREAGSSDDNKGPKPKNLIMLFACPPGEETRGNSDLTEDLLQKLRSCVEADNSQVLPGKLIGWEMPNEGEIMLKSDSNIVLTNVFLPEPAAASDQEEEKK